MDKSEVHRSPLPFHPIPQTFHSPIPATRLCRSTLLTAAILPTTATAAAGIPAAGAARLPNVPGQPARHAVLSAAAAADAGRVRGQHEFPVQWER